MESANALSARQLVLYNGLKEATDKMVIRNDDTDHQVQVEHDSVDLPVVTDYLRVNICGITKFN